MKREDKPSSSDGSLLLRNFSNDVVGPDTRELHVKCSQEIATNKGS